MTAILSNIDRFLTWRAKDPHRLLALRRAVLGDMKSILKLIEERADWLRSQGTDQWNKPWPDEAGRNSRIEAHLRAGKTWIVCSGDVAIATITTDLDADPHWPEPERSDIALYVHRLVVSQAYAGRRLGAQLLDWAGRTVACDNGARWIRANVWTTNERLHQYYSRLGFSRIERVDMGADPDYPSAALFQRPAWRAMVTDLVPLTETSPR